MLRHALSGAFALAWMAAPALADETHSRCRPASEPRAIIDAAKGSWVELTSDQRFFLEGIWAMDPQTPAGLPFGDKAALAQAPGRGAGGMVFFIDGDLACDGFAVPDELIQMLRHVGAGDVYHEGQL
jgi:hypothetical protein